MGQIQAPQTTNLKFYFSSDLVHFILKMSKSIQIRTRIAIKMLKVQFPGEVPSKVSEHGHALSLTRFQRLSQNWSQHLINQTFQYKSQPRALTNAITLCMSDGGEFDISTD